MEAKPKRRGCPKGGWPSQKAKKEAKLKAVREMGRPGVLPDVTPKREALAKDLLLKRSAYLEPVPTPVPAPTFSFRLEHEGQNLWRVEMLTHEGDRILRRRYVSEGDTKGNALARLRHVAYQLWFLERMPGDGPELVPFQPASHL